MAKNDRIRRLIPIFESGRFYLPPALYYTTHDGKDVDLIEQFINDEYEPFPVGVHDDVIDDIARILDPDIIQVWPKGEPEPEKRYQPKRRSGRSWVTR